MQLCTDLFGFIRSGSFAGACDSHFKFVLTVQNDFNKLEAIPVYVVDVIQIFQCLTTYSFATPRGLSRFKAN